MALPPRKACSGLLCELFHVTICEFQAGSELLVQKEKGDKEGFFQDAKLRKRGRVLGKRDMWAAWRARFRSRPSAVETALLPGPGLPSRLRSLRQGPERGREGGKGAGWSPARSPASLPPAARPIKPPQPREDHSALQRPVHCTSPQPCRSWPERAVGGGAQRCLQTR